MANHFQQQRTQYIEEYVKDNSESARLLKSSHETLPGGTTRSVLLHEPHPLVFEGGRECYVTSADGHEYLDFVSEYCAGMFGHAHPDIISAIQGVTKSGFTLGGANAAEGELSRRLVERFPSVDAIRFCNSGTEANMTAIATAMAYTERKKVSYWSMSFCPYPRADHECTGHGIQQWLPRWCPLILSS